jgi:drug/metabolite transporter (DMT)-like permease
MNAMRALAAGSGLGIALMVASMVVIPLVDATAKYLTAEHSPLFVTWARFAASCLFVVPWAIACFGGGGLLAREGLGIQGLRTLFLAGAMTLFYFAVPHVPLATALGGYFVGPVVASVLAVPVLGERMTAHKTTAVALGFSGALLIVRPGVSAEIGTLFALASGVCFGCYLIVTRTATQTSSPLVILAFQSVFGTLLLTPLAIPAWSWPSTDAIVLIVMMGGLSALSHVLLINAFRLVEASTLAPLVYFELLTAATVGFIVFSEFPEALTWAGIALIVASGLLIAVPRRTPSRVEGN